MFLSRLFGRGPRLHAPAAEAKASRTAAVIAWQGVGRPVWTPRDYAALAREGYQRNPVVHRAVRMVAEAAAGVTLVAFDGEREVPDHPVLGLLARPNARDGGAALLQALYGHLLVSGNAYLERVDLGGVPRELHALRPDRVRVVPGPDGWAQAWDYTAGGRSVRLETPPDGPAPVLHLALFHPLDDHYGLSPMEAAAAALDVHNAAGAWNKALLDNAARPSGALVYAGPAGATMGEEQFQRLKAELEAGFQGPANAGRPLLLEGGLDWKPLSLSPRDMDFVEAKAAAAREIALAFGVPPMLLGLPGDNTYANFAEANRSFWRQTVLPLAARTAQSLAHWLGPAWPGDLRLEPDLDRIEALTAERGELWARVGAADFLTRDEKRAAVGYGAEGDGGAKGGWGGFDPVGSDVTASPRGVGGDVFGGGAGSGGREQWRNQPRVPAGDPDGGQWTTGAGTIASGSGNDDLTTVSGSLEFPIDLTEHESPLDHTIRGHVGKSKRSLYSEVEQRQQLARLEYFDTRVLPQEGVRVGSFPSLTAANKLVSSTLSENLGAVISVATGVSNGAVLEKRFPTATGKEAYAPSLWGGIEIRDTFGVRVIIRNDRTMPMGFRVHTAYPFR